MRNATMTLEELTNYRTHETRSSDASSYDKICTRCGAHDEMGSWGDLIRPCPKETEEHMKKRLSVNDRTLPSRKRAMEGEPSYNDLARAFKWAVDVIVAQTVGTNCNQEFNQKLDSAIALVNKLKFEEEIG